MPSIYSIDLTNTKQRVWQSIQLEPAKPKNDSGRMSGGAIAAVVVSLILILLVGIFLFVWRRKRGQKRTSEPDREEKLLWTPLTTGMNTVDNGLWRPPTKESYGVESEIGLWRPTTIESEGESGLWRPTTIESDRMEGEDGLWRPTTLESDHGEYESLWRPTSLESDNVSRISRGSGRNPQGPATRAGDLEGPVTAGVDLKTTSRVPQGLA
ncbi:hypothetical protein B0O80DRAFT_234392 [Mortierella sp. GBAus27b]|nr:hypothetical protein B0O80DRAFT_234392 [Mortierella sp. GBAus27b]